MPEHILFLTGKLAEKRLLRVLESMHERDFSYEVRNIGVSVAALMTAGMIDRRLETLEGVDRIMVPGLCRGDLQSLSEKLGIPVIRGTDDLKDLPFHFGRNFEAPDLSRHSVKIFAEIVDAAEISLEELLQRALDYRDDGADVIDIGCLPDTDFPGLEDAVKLLKEAGLSVSVDSMDSEELLRAGQAGADYLLSLKESTLWIAEEVEAIPVLIPEEHPQVDSLYRAMRKLSEAGKPYIADSILDPIHFGFTESLIRYSELRKKFPDCEIMMGVGNLTELTEADTTGINAILFGVISELGINSILTTQVSPHARSAVREADAARRMFHAAKEQDSLPKGIDGSLLTVHERNPFSYNGTEINEIASEVKDPSYRIQVSEEGIHVYNRDGIACADDPFELFPELRELSDDAPHAFYMGIELHKAQLALQLGKRYTQDQALDWGAALKTDKSESETNEEYKKAGSTLEAGRKRSKDE
ncbi:MAG: dihydropteroate synthase [Gammaproteobacteria bacterium]|nr:dihydropteroate synthase [Gammaproteobacteria bacterium]